MPVIDDVERPESDIRRRAAWLLAMLAVVAGLFVLLSVTLFKTSGGGGEHGSIGAPPTDISTGTGGATSSAHAKKSSAASSTHASAATSATSSGPVPKPSCPGSATCAVRGDIAGAMTAINDYRTQNHKNAVPATTTAAAQKCALTSGSDCPSSFVWVRVADLSGSGVVKGINSFHSSDDLLDDSAKSFEIGWAYNPQTKSASCAVIRDN